MSKDENHRFNQSLILRQISVLVLFLLWGFLIVFKNKMSLLLAYSLFVLLIFATVLIVWLSTRSLLNSLGRKDKNGK